MIADAQTDLVELLADCWEDPDIFNHAILGRDDPDGQGNSGYWEGQKRIAASVVQYRATVVYTGNIIGKDYLVGGLVPWWLLTRPESLVIVTGPTQTLLGSVTWKEIRRAVAPRPGLIPLGLTASTGIVCSPLRLSVSGDWGALGYSTTSVERASGQHNQHLFVIVEEASGVEDHVWEAIDSLGYERLLAIGNPTRPDGGFIRLIRQAEADARDGIPARLSTNAIRIPSTESPHANLEKSPWGLADATWINSSYRKYGKDSLWCRSHIHAEIPTTAAEALILEAWLDHAANVQRKPLPGNHPIHLTRRISCDLGEGVGRDSSAIIVRDDWGVLEVVFGATLGIDQAAWHVARLKAKWSIPDERISYDRIGVGRDMARELIKHGVKRAIGYAGAAAPMSSDFPNLRSEAAWKLRNRLDALHIPDVRQPAMIQVPFCIPPGAYWQRLREELKTLTYELKGRHTALLKKDDHKKVLGYSPDLSDALIQSFAFS